MSTQLHLSKGLEVHVTVVSVHAMFTPAERFSGGYEHPVPLSHTNGRNKVKEWADMPTHTAECCIFGCKDPLLFASTANGRIQEAESALRGVAGVFKHHDLQAQALRLLSKVHQWAPLEMSGIRQVDPLRHGTEKISEA
jgi:hypothetical protein